MPPSSGPVPATWLAAFPDLRHDQSSLPQAQLCPVSAVTRRQPGAAGGQDRGNESLQGRQPGHHGQVKHLSTAELEAGLAGVRDSPSDRGTVELIVRRPAVDEREVLAEGTLDLAAGLAGDTWAVRGSSRTADRSPHPGMQVTVMNARAALLVAHDADRRQLAGDQFYVDFDIGTANLPPGSWLALGSAVLEVSDQPHTGCAKFSARFGLDALRFVNSPVGRELRLRGMNARVVVPGTVRTGDTIRKCPPGPNS